MKGGEMIAAWRIDLSNYSVYAIPKYCKQNCEKEYLQETEKRGRTILTEDI
jgi:hypothetical protein